MSRYRYILTRTYVSCSRGRAVRRAVVGISHPNTAISISIVFCHLGTTTTQNKNENRCFSTYAIAIAAIGKYNEKLNETKPAQRAIIDST